MAGIGVGTPTGGIHPLLTVSGSIDVNGYDCGVSNPIPHSSHIDAVTTLGERNVGLLWNHQFGVNAPKLEVFKDGPGDLPVVGILQQNTVWRAFARGLYSVAVIKQDFHRSWVLYVQQIRFPGPTPR